MPHQQRPLSNTYPTGALPVYFTLLKEQAIIFRPSIAGTTKPRPL